MSLHQQQPQTRPAGTNVRTDRRGDDLSRMAAALSLWSQSPRPYSTTAGCNGDETCDSPGRCSSTVGQQHVQVGNEPPRLDQSPW